MKFKFKPVFFVSILVVTLFFIKSAYAITIVTDWDSLKKYIENSNKTKIVLELVPNNSDSWKANKKISIQKEQNVVLIVKGNILVKRESNFGESLIDNFGSLTIKPNSDKNFITFDGNKFSIQNSDSLITVNEGILNLCNVVICNNSSVNNGGAIQAESSDLTIDNSKFLNNEGKAGGALFIKGNGSHTQINNVKICNNTATDSSGGGIYACGELHISGESTEISDNNANTFGGGIIIKHNAIIDNGKIERNVAYLNSGGGIRVDGKLTLKSATIINNSAAKTGGGIDYTQGLLDFQSGVLTGNKANKLGEECYPDYRHDIDWTKDESLNLKKVHLDEVKSYVKGQDIPKGILQGMAITDKHIVFAQTITNQDKTKLSILDKNSFKLLNTISDYCFGHASDLAYNPNTKEILIVGMPNKIVKFKIDNDCNLNDVTFIDSVRTYSGIAYDENEDFYVTYRAGVMYILNKYFEEIYSFPIIRQLINQGITYKDGFIYYSCYESGNPKRPVFNKKEKWSNLIYIYDLQGKLHKTLYIPNTEVAGEIENLGFYDDGSLLIGYNRKIGDKAKVSFYKTYFND